MKTQRTGIHYDSCYEHHETGPGHPESPARYRALRAALEELPEDFVRLPRRRATVAEILLAHEAYYHDVVYRDVASCADVLRTGDTALSEDSYDVALDASGAVLAAVDAVMKGDIRRAFCAVRPPGHHATADRGMGFCIFNHVAVAARYLQKRHGLKRIAIVDWDVHHGNGTEAIFYEDPSVFYLSLHQYPLYPYTGSAGDTGSGTGEGATLNIPLAARSGGAAALAAWDAQAAPALDAFAPEFVLVSAGFDARIKDPLGDLEWDDATFVGLTKRVVALAEKHAGGRVVSSLEGGYYPPGLASAAVAHAQAMAGEFIAPGP
ncbi:histone deacetylase family protein [Luteolibacter luteus]|uniref:Histone deacetylase n=1 Tax=Luteolibacter luteus TaxID=2728835 RepID=A0A858RJJ9_9BACT|nr:histone deacetylase [Luteolibacter luteus]QJE97446.1 histone deacetylase [Luteolibacter luteus]